MMPEFPRFANFPFALEVEIFKFTQRTVHSLVHDITTAVGLPIFLTARIQNATLHLQ